MVPYSINQACFDITEVVQTRSDLLIEVRRRRKCLSLPRAVSRCSGKQALKYQISRPHLLGRLVVKA